MSPIILSLVAATALVSAAPALATSGSQTRTVLKYDAKSGKYCVTDPATTGSHIPRVTCQTAAQWTAAGLDMPNAARVVSAQRTEALIAQK